MNAESLRKATQSRGCVHSWSSECMWCEALCSCSDGQCSRMWETEPGANEQKLQRSEAALPILCMKEGREGRRVGERGEGTGRGGVEGEESGGRVVLCEGWQRRHLHPCGMCACWRTPEHRML